MAKNAKKKTALRMKKLANGGMQIDDGTGNFALVKGGGGKKGGGKKGKLGKMAKKPKLDVAFAKMIETVMGERWNAAQCSLNLQQLLQDPRLTQWVDKVRVRGHTVRVGGHTGHTSSTTSSTLRMNG